MYSQTQFLPDEWRRWIASQKLQGVADGAIVHEIVKKGYDIRIAQAEVRAIAAHPCFQLSSELAAKVQTMEGELNLQTQQIQRLEYQLDIYHQIEKTSPKYGTIERVSRPSRQEFLEKYYLTNTPVIITDIMSNWPGLKLWNPDYLKAKYGDVLVDVQFNRTANPLYEIEKSKHKKTMPLGEYADLVVNGGVTNDYYMVPFNGNLYKKELQGLFEEMDIFPEYLDPLKQNQIAFWFGPAGTVTPLHYDAISSLLTQVYGRKRIRLISPNQKHLVYNYQTYFSSVDLENPDLDKYPRFRDVNIMETVLHPGEVMFMPVGWWHHVNGLDITISVSFMNFLFDNNYKSVPC
ncbi:MAG TPA: cupin-like domain-containing protein [Oscillatoriaceae cyanobacterium M33_DOE_052]|uniref:Cupin-like domain-containing protein n=1 Tax=Planktothricoides sp. SpSt-374 TaxID=2282167 RepID=A0A7C3VUE5_9CYAN|nr:cupin-like domain-containing protein [Oscillatoriaceae cyanobacterium M33_DOE_052]